MSTFDVRKFNSQSINKKPFKKSLSGKPIIGKPSFKRKPLSGKKDFHIVETNTPKEVMQKAFTAVRHKYYNLYEKLDKLSHKPRMNSTITDAQSAYEIAQKLTEFIKVAITRLKAYENKKENDENRE